MGCTQAERCAGLCGCGLKAVRCLTGFLSRSFENNWNIYKLLAHQKLSKEKVRGWALQGHSHCHPALRGLLNLLHCWGQPAAPHLAELVGLPSCLGSELQAERHGLRLTSRSCAASCLGWRCLAGQFSYS